LGKIKGLNKTTLKTLQLRYLN